MINLKSFFSRRTLPAITSAALLIFIGAERLEFRASPANAQQYHRAIQLAAAKLPLVIDGWSGVDMPVPSGAIALLRPNVLIARRFRQLQGDREFTFLLIQCEDARDMLGHYPPACYAAQGWQQIASTRRSARVENDSLDAMEYRFEGNQSSQSHALLVDDFMLMPDGSTCLDMDGLESAARKPRMRFFGAAQMQFVFDDTFDLSQRTQIVQRFVDAHSGVVQLIRHGS